MTKYEVKIDEDGHKAWYLNGLLHREDGPAIEKANGPKLWYLNGERHREDGPAIELACGHKEWYLNGQECSERIFLQKTGATNTKMSEESDSMASLSLDDLKEITEVLKDCNYMVPSCFWKLVKMMEKLDVPKEMTVEEIEKQLGHSIKVVK